MRAEHMLPCTVPFVGMIFAELRCHFHKLAKVRDARLTEVDVLPCYSPKDLTVYNRISSINVNRKNSLNSGILVMGYQPHRCESVR